MSAHPALLRTILVGLSALAIPFLWGLAYSNSLAQVGGFTEGKCPAGVRSVPLHVLCVLVTFFEAAISHQYGHQLLIFILSVLVAPLGIASIHTGALRGILLFPTLGQLVGAGLAAPAFFSINVHPPTRQNSRYLGTIVPALVLGFVVPSLAMLFPSLVPSFPPSTLIAFWQFFPVWMYTASTLLYPLLPPHTFPSTPTGVLRSLSFISLVSYYYSIYSLYRNYPSLSTIVGVFTAPRPVQNYSEAAYLFLLVDCVFIFLPTFFFVLLAPVSEQKTLRKDNSVKDTMWNMVLLFVVGGPGFGLLEEWRWRLKRAELEGASSD